jgi:hypothetical protein
MAEVMEFWAGSLQPAVAQPCYKREYRYWTENMPDIFTHELLLDSEVSMQMI